MPKADKNSTLHCTLISLRYVYVITLFANLHFLIFTKKSYLWLFDLRRYAEQSKAKTFYDISAEKFTLWGRLKFGAVSPVKVQLLFPWNWFEK